MAKPQMTKRQLTLQDFVQFDFSRHGLVRLHARKNGYVPVIVVEMALLENGIVTGVGYVLDDSLLERCEAAALVLHKGLRSNATTGESYTMAERLVTIPVHEVSFS